MRKPDERDECTSGLDRMLTQQELAHWLQVTPRTVRRWVAEGRLRQVTPPGSTVARYRPSDVEAFLNGGVQCHVRSMT
jgi:excisionase family DNA binding protein